MRKIIGDNFASLRKKRDLTQHEAAEASGFTQAYIGWLERGQRNSTAISLWHLARAVDAMPVDLVTPAERN